MSRVFVLNYSGHNVTSAEDFGELIYLTEGDINIWDTDRVNYLISKRLQNYNYDPKEDFVALSGNLVLGYVLGNILGQYDAVNLLIWDSVRRKYFPRKGSPTKTLNNQPNGG